MKDGMIDNRKVKDNHQQGIERVLQRGKRDNEGHNGKMGKGAKADWHPNDNGMSPKKA